jgi:hypothetical protein
VRRAYNMRHSGINHKNRQDVVVHADILMDQLLPVFPSSEHLCICTESGDRHKNVRPMVEGDL